MRIQPQSRLKYHIVLPGSTSQKISIPRGEWIDVETPLPVEPQDTTALSLYIRRLMDMDEDS